MQLDPKAKLAARRAYQTEVSNRDMWHADGGPDDTPMDCAIRAYLSAAPSPSPAPGVVEALKQATDRFEEIRLILVHHLHEPERSAFWKAVDGRTKCQTALASLSQPAKGEREGGEADYRDWLAGHEDPATGFVKAPLTPANPAQGVSDEMVEAGLNSWFDGEIPVSFSGDFRADMRAALTAAIGAGGQAVAEPYAHEYGKSNGDGTFSVTIEKGHPRKPVPDWPIKPLYAHPVQPGWRPTHRHKKRGGEYMLLGIGKMQTSNWMDEQWSHEPQSGNPPQRTLDPVDMSEVAIYRGEDGKLWVRPREEFEDGRFEALPAAPQPKGE